MVSYLRFAADMAVRPASAAPPLPPPPVLGPAANVTGSAVPQATSYPNAILTRQVTLSAA
jgi:hypothetical protein